MDFNNKICLKRFCQDWRQNIDIQQGGCRHLKYDLKLRNRQRWLAFYLSKSINNEGNNRPPSVNLKSLVKYHNKTGNKCHIEDNTETRKTQVRAYM